MNNPAASPGARSRISSAFQNASERFRQMPKKTRIMLGAIAVVVIAALLTLGISSAASASAHTSAFRTAQASVKKANAAIESLSQKSQERSDLAALIKGYSAAYKNVMDNTTAGFSQKQVDESNKAKDALAKTSDALAKQKASVDASTLALPRENQNNDALNKQNRNALKVLHRVQAAQKVVARDVDAATKVRNNANKAALALDASVKDVKDATLSANGAASDDAKNAYGAAADNAVRISAGKFSDDDRKKAQADAGNYTDDTAKAALSVDPQKLNDVYIPLTFARSYESALAGLIQSTADAATDDTQPQDAVINNAQATPQQKAQAQQIKQAKQQVAQKKSNNNGGSKGTSTPARGGSNNSGSKGNSGGGSSHTGGGSNGGGSAGSNNGSGNSGGGSNNSGGNNGGGGTTTQPSQPPVFVPVTVTPRGAYTPGCERAGLAYSAQPGSGGGSIINLAKRYDYTKTTTTVFVYYCM